MNKEDFKTEDQSYTYGWDSAPEGAVYGKWLKVTGISVDDGKRFEHWSFFEGKEADGSWLGRRYLGVDAILDTFDERAWRKRKHTITLRMF